MITINGKRFAKNASEFTESLFDKGGTCIGFYKRRKDGVALYDMQKALVGVVTNGRVLACATRLENGRFWYSYATIDLIGRHESYTQERADIDAALSAA